MKAGHETGHSGKKTQQRVVWKELNREDGQRRRERARLYGEIAQPSHLLKERLISIHWLRLFLKCFTHSYGLHC
jgi:hypothetical protein